jgi:chorismate-pyruvate lyase
MKNLGKYVRKKKLEDGREECRILVERKEKNTEKKERKKYYQNRVYQRRSGQIKSKRKME